MKVLLSSKVLCCCNSVQNSRRALSPQLMEGLMAILGVFLAGPEQVPGKKASSIRITHPILTMSIWRRFLSQEGRFSFYKINNFLTIALGNRKL